MTVVRWGVRIVVFGAILMALGVPKGDRAAWYFEPDYTQLCGALLAAELVVRAWQRVEPARVGRSRRIALLLSALVLTMASNTFERPPIHTLAPVYALLVVLTLRRISSDAPLGPLKRLSEVRGGRRGYALWGLRGAAILLALAVGLGAVLAVTKYDNRITAWAVNLLRQSKTPPRDAAIGFTGTPRLGQVFNPEATLDRVFLIDGPHGERHLRMITFDTYESRQWRPPMPTRSFAPVGGTFPAKGPAGAAAATLRFSRLADTADVLAVPSDAVAIRSTGEVEREPLGTIRDTVAAAASAYEVDLAAAGGTPYGVPLAEPPDANERQRLLTVPKGIDPRVVELAKQVAGAGDAARQLIRLQQHLRTRHTYSLSYDPGGADEPLNDFILNARSAHCQYFASSMVVLARSVGIPARLATGYFAHEGYGQDRMVVRERDAHAWTECWLDGLGWVTVDATPASGRPDGLFPNAPWYRRLWERIKDLPGQIREWFGQLSRERVYAVIAVAAVIGIVVWIVRIVWRLRRRRKSNVDSQGYAAPAADLVDAARRFERCLRIRGIPCPPNRTWREHVERMPAESSQRNEQPAMIDFVEAYDTSRFGGAGPRVASRLGEALERLEGASSPKEH
jgi:transglutaminase-like putative cysteine protease